MIEKTPIYRIWWPIFQDSLGKPVLEGKTSLDFNETRDDGVFGWQCHRPDHMQTICILLWTDNHASTSSLNFYRPDAFPDAQTKLSEHWRHKYDRWINGQKTVLSLLSVGIISYVCVYIHFSPTVDSQVRNVMLSPAVIDDRLLNHCTVGSYFQTDRLTSDLMTWRFHS